MGKKRPHTKGIMPLQSGLPTVQQSLEKSLAIALRKGGVSTTHLVRRLKELLDAHETKFFQHEGQVTDSREVIAWGPRADGLRLATEILKWRGAGAEAQGPPAQGSLSVTVNLIRAEAGPGATPGQPDVEGGNGQSRIAGLQVRVDRGDGDGA